MEWFFLDYCSFIALCQIEHQLRSEDKDVPGEIETVLSEHKLDYDSESVGLIVDIALTLYEGLMEYTQNKIETEKVIFKPRIEREEEVIKEDTGNLANHRNEDDDLYDYDRNLTDVAVKLTLDSDGDTVEGFVFDTIDQDLVKDWRETISEKENDIGSEFGFKSQFPNIYTQSDAIFEAMRINQVKRTEDPERERTLSEEGIVVSETEGDQSPLDLTEKVSTEKIPEELDEMLLTDDEKSSSVALGNVLTKEEKETFEEEAKTGLKKQKKRRRRRRKPIYDRESGFLPAQRKNGSYDREPSIVAPYKTKFRPGLRSRNRRKRFPKKKSIRRSQSKKNAKGSPFLESVKYQEEKLSYKYPKIQLDGRPLRVNSLLGSVGRVNYI